MKGKSLSMVGLVAVIIGVILGICYRDITASGVVVTGGILFIIIGVFNLVVVGQSNKEGRAFGKFMAQLANVAAIALGVCLLVFKDVFMPYVALVFGVLVCLCALWQFYLLAVGLRPVTLPAWLYVFPLVLLGGSIFIFTRGMGEVSVEKDALVMLSTGVAMAVFGVGCFLEGASLGIAHRHIKAASDSEGADQGKETTEDLDAPMEVEAKTE